VADAAELELGVLQREGLPQCTTDRETVARNVRAWTDWWTAAIVALAWRCMTSAARTKRRRLYPACHV